MNVNGGYKIEFGAQRSKLFGRRMARVSIRKFFKISVSFLSHPNSTPAQIQPSKRSSSSYSSLSHIVSKRTHSLYKKTLDFLDHCDSLTHLYQIQARLITSGLLQHPSFSGRLIAISTHLCELDYTLLIFRCIAFPSAFCVNTVIKAYACSSIPQKAVIFYFEMLKDGFFPNSFSFPPLLSACAKTGSLNLGHKCHGHVLKNGVDRVLPIQNSLVYFYACCGLMDAVRRIFDDMPVKDMVSWNSTMCGLVKSGELEMAHKLFDAMPRRNVISWNIMITGYLDLGNPGNGLKLFREMVSLGFRGNETTMVNVLTACGRSGRLKEGKSVHRALIRDFDYWNMIIHTSLIDMYSKCGRLNDAQLIFDRMPITNLVSWNAMILGHCIHGNPQDGLHLFDKLLSRNSYSEDEEMSLSNKFNSSDHNRIAPDEVTFIGVLIACAREERLIEGRNYFSQMVEVFGLKPNFAHYWCMANILDAVGHRKEAIELLLNMPISRDASPEISLWAGLFRSSRFQGDIVLGEQIAKDLIEQDPQNFSYFALLVNIYAVAGKWEEVARIKAIMKERGIKRIPGCCLKDMKEIVHQLEVGNKWQELTDTWYLTTQEVKE